MTGQTGSQVTVKVFWLRKVCATYKIWIKKIIKYILWITKNNNFSPFLRISICWNSQRQKIFLLCQKLIFQIHFLNLSVERIEMSLIPNLANSRTHEKLRRTSSKLACESISQNNYILVK